MNNLTINMLQRVSGVLGCAWSETKKLVEEPMKSCFYFLILLFVLSGQVFAGNSSGGGTGYTTKSAFKDYISEFSAEKILECVKLESPKAQAIVKKLQQETSQECPRKLHYRVGAILYRHDSTSYYDPNDLPDGRETHTYHVCRVMVTSVCRHAP